MLFRSEANTVCLTNRNVVPACSASRTRPKASLALYRAVYKPKSPQALTVGEVCTGRSLSKKLSWPSAKSKSKQSKQQGIAFTSKSELNKARLNRRLKQPFTVWGFVMDTNYCRTEILGCRRPHSSEARVRGARITPKREPTSKPSQPERSSGLCAQDLCNIVTKTRYQTIRPLLNLSRENLTTLCKYLRLPVYPDKSNKAVQYSRNRLREQILPAVKLFLNPKVDDALFKLAELLIQDFSVVSHLVNTGCGLK